MAQYRATIQGNRGAASRLGSKASGLGARVNGWSLGAEVRIDFNGTEDVLEVYITRGSSPGSRDARRVVRIKASEVDAFLDGGSR